uniref:Taste receptor type 2 n=1 Tax=Pyxicephalus adspersus TaxID=30357 RepID=A0AAV3ARK8_PYXAD|nr:TPA: hypothetical protein GDO54_009865 [Pyxicephalus adspersus]
MIGLMINSFIVAVNVIDWLNGRVISSTDKILTTLGISRIVFQISSFSYGFLTTFFKGYLNSSPIRYVVDVAEVFSTQFSFCLTTLLSIVFCLKVSNFHTNFLQQMKKFILRRVVHFIIMSLLFSIFYASIQTWEDNFVTLMHTENNTTTGGSEGFTVNIAFLLIFVIGNTLPFLVYCFAATFLVVSLYHHIYRMKANGNILIQMDTYYTAIKFMALSFLYYIVHSVSTQGIVYYYYFHKLDSLLLYVSVDCIPILQSIYLIWATAKLRNRTNWILQRMAKCLCNRKGPQAKSCDWLETIAQ